MLQPMHKHRNLLNKLRSYTIIYRLSDKHCYECSFSQLCNTPIFAKSASYPLFFFMSKMHEYCLENSMMAIFGFLISAYL